MVIMNLIAVDNSYSHPIWPPVLPTPPSAYLPHTSSNNVLFYYSITGLFEYGLFMCPASSSCPSARKIFLRWAACTTLVLLSTCSGVVVACRGYDWGGWVTEGGATEYGIYVREGDDVYATSAPHPPPPTKPYIRLLIFSTHTSY